MGRKKKKRKQRRSEPQAAAVAPAAAPAPPSAPAEAQVVDVGVDLEAELDDAGESYDSLVAAVAGMEDETPDASANDHPPAAEEEAEEIHDLDDDADVAAGSVRKLIAEVGREAPAEVRSDDFDDDVPVIDLDEDAPPAAPARTPLPAAPASPEVARLARAAAAGGVSDPEPPPIPLDLFGDVSTPESRARLLAEALAHAEHKEARYRVPVADRRRASRIKSAVASLLFVLAVVVAVAPPAWVRPQPPAQLSDAARLRGIHLALLLQAQQVEAHRVRTQELPSSLDQLPVMLDGVRYTRSGRSYQLVAFLPDGSPVVFDAADPSPPFRALEAALAAVGAP